MSRIATAVGASLLCAAVIGCHQGFNARNFKGTHEDLYRAALREAQRGKWENAEDAFERLTLELPARDTLLPRAHWYLAQAQYKRHEYLLAAQSFGRLTDLFPDDTLADDAMFKSARSYERLWRSPVLDADEGETALSSFEAFRRAYPESPLMPAAEKEIAHLNEWKAQKDYQNGMQYMRRHAYDSAIIYFKDVVRLYPTSATARLALLKMYQAFTAIHYRDDATEACTVALQSYPDDKEVRTTCAKYASAARAAGVPPAYAPASTEPQSITNPPQRIIPDSTVGPVPATDSTRADSAGKPPAR